MATDPNIVSNNIKALIGKGAPEADVDAYVKSEGYNTPEEFKAARQPSTYQKISTALNLPGYGRSLKNIGQMPYNVAVKPFENLYKYATMPKGTPVQSFGEGSKEFGKGLIEPYVHPKKSFHEDPINTALAYVPLYEALSAGTRAAGIGARTAAVSKLTKAASADIPEVMTGIKQMPKPQKPFNLSPSPSDVLKSDIPNELIKQSIETNTPLIDIGGEQIYGLAETAKLANKKARVRIQEHATNTLKKQSTELQKIVNKTLGEKSKLQNLDDIQAKYEAEARPAYDAAFAKGDLSQMAEFVKKDDLLQKYIKQARGSALGRELKGLPDTHIKVLDAAKQSLDDSIGRAIKAGEKNEARVLQGLKKELTDGVDSIVPEYAEARSIASERFRLEEAQDTAKKIVDTENPEAIGRIVPNMTAAEKEAFMIGIRDKLMAEISKGSKTGRANIAEKMFGNDENYTVRQNLKAALGEEDYKNLMSEVNPLVRSGYNASRLLGGSQTAEKLTGLAQGQIPDSLRRGVKKMVGSGIKSLFSKKYDPISKMLTNPEFLKQQVTYKKGLPSLRDLIREKK